MPATEPAHPPCTGFSPMPDPDPPAYPELDPAFQILLRRSGMEATVPQVESWVGAIARGEGRPTDLTREHWALLLVRAGLGGVGPLARIEDLPFEVLPDLGGLLTAMAYDSVDRWVQLHP